MKLPPDHALRVHLAFAPDDDVTVGRLLWRRGRIWFEHDAAFLTDPLPLSPFRLPPGPGVVEGPLDPFEGLHGLFADSLPDGWGRLLVDRRALTHGLEPGALTPLDRLACVGSSGMGALAYEPALLPGAPPREIALRALWGEIESVLVGHATDVLDELLRVGGSPHGARPKALVALRPSDGHCVTGDPPPDHIPVLVKFPSRADPPDVGAMELAWARMAAAAGIEVPPAWLIPGGDGPGFYAVRRFDREGHRRVHVHTLCGLLHADHRVGSLDYRAALAAVHRLTQDIRAVEQMARRMAFNVLAHNRDDHTKQHALRMARDGTWTLAPAYDLTFSEGPGGEHSMTVGGAGHPTRADVIRVAEEAGLASRHARALVDDVASAVAGWRGFAAEAGVGRALVERMARALP